MEGGGKGFQEQLWRTHGQNQGGVEAREGGREGWCQGVNTDNCN